MSQLDAIALTESVRQRLIDFASDSNFVSDPRLTDISRRLWGGSPEQGGMISDLWVEGAFPAEQADQTLDAVVCAGDFDADLRDHLHRRRAVPRDRQLYTHQHEALKAAQKTDSGHRPALVVTAGTGAGKTESFLLPILNELWTRPKQGTGVQCLILYPMNALVNDQVERLYNWLSGQSKLTLFHFTGETPEDKRAAEQDGIEPYKACRFRTRQQARGRETADGKKIDQADRGPIPDILITNYSMLEYMLCRPQDAVFFGSALRTIVLDEAHLYTGTLAAEITLLLRRLSERCERPSSDILQIATSATIGSGAPDELKTFAATLFSKDPSDVHVIGGRPARVPLPSIEPPIVSPSRACLADEEWLTVPTLIIDSEGNSQFNADAAASDDLIARLATLTSHTPNADDRPAVLLHDALGHAPLLHQAENLLWEQKRMPLRDMAMALWGRNDEEAIRATTTLLQLGASARPQVSDYPLLPHRIHLLARPADGLVVCLNTDCKGDPTLKLPGLGCVLAGIADICPYCEAAVLTLMRCANCGTWVLAGIQDLNGLRTVKDILQESQTIHYFSLFSVPETSSLRLDRQTGVYHSAGADGIELWNVGPCPKCDTDAKDAWQPFHTHSNLTLAILAETALAALPPYPSLHHDFLPAQGRRMLAFSDSRTEAARLGPRLTRQHETQLVRAILSRALVETPVVDAATLADLNEEIVKLVERLRSPDLSPSQIQREQKRLDGSRQELIEATAGGALADWADAVKHQSSMPQIPDAVTLSHDTPDQWREDPEAIWDKNSREVKRSLPDLLARELARPTRRQVSLETLGLAEITYPGLDALTLPADLAGRIPTNEARTKLRGCWTDFLAALCDTLRTDAVITLGDDQDQAYDFGGAVLGKWAAADIESRSRLVRFVGTNTRQTRRKFASAVLLACGLTDVDSKEMSKDVLRTAFSQLHENAGDTLIWLEAGQKSGEGHQIVPAIRILFDHLALCRPPQIFRCPTTGHLWPRSVLGCAPESGCVRLEAVTEEELDWSPRVGRQRREFRESSVFSQALWADEHSAQLAPSENRRLQDLFKAGARNILSSTTTLELGIDIGGLNAVLMGNVPPGKANYLQRAGRAGRRADGSSIVLTFCRLRPFDREVFRRFGDYLQRPLRQPRVFLDRIRVIKRHCHAFLLGEFFRSITAPDARRGAMNAFGHMGIFCGKKLPPWWEGKEPKPKITASGPGLEAQFVSYLNDLRDNKVAQMQPTLVSLFAGTALERDVTDWQTLLRSAINDFTEAVIDWGQDYDNLWTAWQSLDDEPANRSQANALHYQMANLSGTTVIEALADCQFLPRYGFPIGVLKLRVIVPDENRPHRVREEDQFRLERSGLMAIGEYVPGSQLLVGGKLVTSHGLLKSWSDTSADVSFGLRGQMTVCSNNHTYYVFSGALGACPLCSAVPAESARDLLLPRYGFSSAAWDPPKFSSDVERVGRTERLTIAFHNTAETTLVADFGEIKGMHALYRDDGDLLVINPGEYRNGFALCTKCGYADSENKYGNGRVNLPSGFEHHAPMNRSRTTKDCMDRSTVILRNQVLAARQTTDVLMLDLSECSGSNRRNEALAQTLGMALQTAGAQLLELDGREMGMLVTAAGHDGDGWGVVLYDNTPGGAGHVRELLDVGREWLIAARQILFVDAAHHQRCETGCLDCLLTYDGQFALAGNLLERRLAITVLDALLKGTNIPQVHTNTPFNADPAQDSLDPMAAVRSERRRKRLSS